MGGLKGKGEEEWDFETFLGLLHTGVSDEKGLLIGVHVYSLFLGENVEKRTRTWKNFRVFLGGGVVGRRVWGGGGVTGTETKTERPRRNSGKNDREKQRFGSVLWGYWCSLQLLLAR